MGAGGIFRVRPPGCAQIVDIEMFSLRGGGRIDRNVETPVMAGRTGSADTVPPNPISADRPNDKCRMDSPASPRPTLEEQ